MQAAPLATASDVARFMFAGKATLTLVSKKTGSRYTYRVNEAERKNDNDPRAFFVALLTGPDSYQYIGLMRDDGTFRTTAKSRLPVTSPPVAGFKWAAEMIVHERLPETLEVWHEGRCGRCGRKLTVPESIANGIGPDCAGRM